MHRRSQGPNASGQRRRSAPWVQHSQRAYSDANFPLVDVHSSQLQHLDARHAATDVLPSNRQLSDSSGARSLSTHLRGHHLRHEEALRCSLTSCSSAQLCNLMVKCSASQSFSLHAALRFNISATLVNAASNTSSYAQRYVVLQRHLVLVSSAVLVLASLCIPAMYGTRICAVVRCTATSYRVLCV